MNDKEVNESLNVVLNVLIGKICSKVVDYVSLFWKQTLHFDKFLIGVEILMWSDCLLDI